MYQYALFNPNTIFLKPTDPQLSFNADFNNGIVKKNIMKRQLISDIMFLTYFWSNDITDVIYIDPTASIYVLHSLFNINFHIFSTGISNELTNTYYTRIINYGRMFEESDLEYFLNDIGSDHIALISFINIHRYGVSSNETHVWNNMIDQQNIVALLNPKVCKLRFKLPYRNTDIDFTNMVNELDIRDITHDISDVPVVYLDGFIFLDPHRKYNSTESSLISIRNQDGNYSKTVYHLKMYEDMCFYHNFVFRNSIYKNIFTGDETRLDTRVLNTYDNTLTFHILKEHLKAIGYINDDDDEFTYVKAFNRSIDQYIDHIK